MNPLLPPTPTMLPPSGPAPVLINSAAWRMWNFTDEAIMVWQQIGPSRTQVFQVAFLIVIIVGFIFLAMSWIKSLTNEGGA